MICDTLERGKVNYCLHKNILDGSECCTVNFVLPVCIIVILEITDSVHDLQGLAKLHIQALDQEFEIQQQQCTAINLMLFK